MLELMACGKQPKENRMESNKEKGGKVKSGRKKMKKKKKKKKKSGKKGCAHINSIHLKYSLDLWWTERVNRIDGGIVW